MMRLVVNNTNSARLPSHAQTGSGVILSAPLPTHCGDRGNGPVAKIGRATDEESTSRGPVTHHTWSPWLVHNEWHDLSKYEVPLS